MSGGGAAIGSLISGSQPRGLHNFISEIRNATSKEEERSRVDKELGNIRQKFSTSAQLSSYHKKKYVWKMCYIYMLGYEVDFGHLEFISLLGSTNFTEKSVGYMAVALLLRPGDELMTLVINSMRNDIVGPYLHGKMLALAAVSNIGGSDLAEALSADVQRIITTSLDAGPGYNTGAGAETDARNRAALIKKASLCLLRLYRTNPECLEVEEWLQHLAKLLEDRDLGVITSAMSLLLGLASHSTPVFEPLVPYVVSILTRLVIDRRCVPDYLYYRTPSPWLQVKCLRFLQYYKEPEGTQNDLLSEVLIKILSRTESSESVNKNNADNSILFEAIALTVSYGVDAPVALKDLMHSLLARFIGVKDANVRYLGLDMLARVAKQDETAKQEVQKYQEQVLESMKDADVSVRRRALELIFVITDESNAELLVGDFVKISAAAESMIKEEMVVKIAILAERFSKSLNWYLDTMIQVILVAGDFVAEAVWYRVVQIVTNHQEIHEYAAEKLLAAVQSKYCHEVAVSLAGYLLGEIGVNVCERPGMSGYDQFAALHQHFPLISFKVQAILLTTYMKLLNQYPDTREYITSVFSKLSTSSQLELQQRACEYLAMPSVGVEMMEQVLKEMPPYAEDKESPLMHIHAQDHETSDRAAWKISQTDKDASREERLAQKEQRERELSEREAAAPTSSRNRSSMSPQGGGGGGSNSGSGSGFAASSSRTPPAPAAQADLLSMDDAAPSSSQSSNLSASAQEQVNVLYKRALIAGTGVKAQLLDTDEVTISTSAEYRAHAGRMTMTIYNKANSDLTDFRVEVPTLEQLVVRIQPPSARIVAGDEGRAMFAIDCMRPFVDSPLVNISFSLDRRQYNYSLKLPISAASFFEAISTNKETYMARWKALESEKGEQQEVFSASKPIDSNTLAFIRQQLVPALKLGLAEGLDNENTVTGCSSFRTGTPGPDGNPIAVGGMIRIEADTKGNRFRVTVRAKHPTIALALKEAYKIQLA